jgi:hypothetical protein
MLEETLRLVRSIATQQQSIESRLSTAELYSEIAHENANRALGIPPSLPGFGASTGHLTPASGTYYNALFPSRTANPGLNITTEDNLSAAQFGEVVKQISQAFPLAVATVVGINLIELSFGLMPVDLAAASANLSSIGGVRSISLTGWPG